MKRLMSALALCLPARAGPLLPPDPLGDLARRCAQHDAAACTLAGELTREGGRDVGAALRVGCGLGDIKACQEAARIYVSGRRVPGDLGRAAALIARACDLGDGRSCRRLAEAHFKGVGQDLPRSGQLPRQACERGDRNSCWRIERTLREVGQDPGSIPQDPAFLGFFCELGLGSACQALAGQAGWP
ncbi:MAG: hypothetical protein K6A65_05870 [Succinivibrionaceae bacterium]|nr:hypothetical protein [Succinivibrionaceae bacterium]